MKLSTIASVLIFAASAIAAVNPNKYIVSFPKGTPQSEVDQAKKNLEDKGAVITHVYRKSPIDPRTALGS